MGVNTYPCDECNECFYEYWAGCDACNNRCDEWLDKLVCYDCFKDDKFAMYKLEINEEEFIICDKCRNGPITDLYEQINDAHCLKIQEKQICQKSFDVSLLDFEEAIFEHNEFYNSKEQIRGRYLKEMVDLMEKIERDIREVDLIAEKISNLHD